MPEASRRDFIALLGAAALVGLQPRVTSGRAARKVRVRAITGGVDLAALGDKRRVESTLGVLARARRRFESEGYEVQTTRVTLPSLVAGLGAAARGRALADLASLDEMVAAAGAVLGLGPVLAADRADESLAAWATELVQATRATSFSVAIASPSQGVHGRAASTAAAVMRAVAQAKPDGSGSFRFAAAANVPAGTPFFPVGWHEGTSALAIGLESAGLVGEGFTGAVDDAEARHQLAALMTSELREVERIAQDIARAEGRRYLGIDTSPAPMGGRSIGAAIELLTGVPFGEAGTLRACALITDVVKHLDVRTCGYAGLMLPVLEDAVLARRAAEGRYGLRDLLLFSSVCGTGLDVVPIPGDTPPATLTNILLDVAAQAVKLRKALSARLYLVPGKSPGDRVHFDDPLLNDSVVFRAT